MYVRARQPPIYCALHLTADQSPGRYSLMCNRLLHAGERCRRASGYDIRHVAAWVLKEQFARLDGILDSTVYGVMQREQPHRNVEPWKLSIEHIEGRQ